MLTFLHKKNLFYTAIMGLFIWSSAVAVPSEMATNVEKIAACSYLPVTIAEIASENWSESARLKTEIITNGARALHAAVATYNHHGEGEEAITKYFAFWTIVHGFHAVHAGYKLAKLKDVEVKPQVSDDSAKDSTLHALKNGCRVLTSCAETAVALGIGCGAFDENFPRGYSPKKYVHNNEVFNVTLLDKNPFYAGLLSGLQCGTKILKVETKKERTVWSAALALNVLQMFADKKQRHDKVIGFCQDSIDRRQQIQPVARRLAEVPSVISPAGDQGQPVVLPVGSMENQKQPVAPRTHGKSVSGLAGAAAASAASVVVRPPDNSARRTVQRSMLQQLEDAQRRASHRETQRVENERRINDRIQQRIRAFSQLDPVAQQREFEQISRAYEVTLDDDDETSGDQAREIREVFIGCQRLIRGQAVAQNQEVVHGEAGDQQEVVDASNSAEDQQQAAEALSSEEIQRQEEAQLQELDDRVAEAKRREELQLQEAEIASRKLEVEIVRHQQLQQIVATFNQLDQAGQEQELAALREELDAVKNSDEQVNQDRASELTNIIPFLTGYVELNKIKNPKYEQKNLNRQHERALEQLVNRHNVAQVQEAQARRRVEATRKFEEYQRQAEVRQKKEEEVRRQEVAAAREREIEERRQRAAEFQARERAELEARREARELEQVLERVRIHEEQERQAEIRRRERRFFGLDQAAQEVALVVMRQELAAIPESNDPAQAQQRSELQHSIQACEFSMQPVPADAVCVLCTQEGVNRQLPCGHAFHDACISLWTKEHRACPICRHNV